MYLQKIFWQLKYQNMTIISRGLIIFKLYFFPWYLFSNLLQFYSEEEKGLYFLTQQNKVFGTLLFWRSPSSNTCRFLHNTSQEFLEGQLLGPLLESTASFKLLFTISQLYVKHYTSFYRSWKNVRLSVPSKTSEPEHSKDDVGRGLSFLGVGMGVDSIGVGISRWVINSVKINKRLGEIQLFMNRDQWEPKHQVEVEGRVWDFTPMVTVTQVPECSRVGKVSGGHITRSSEGLDEECGLTGTGKPVNTHTVWCEDSLWLPVWATLWSVVKCSGPGLGRIWMWRTNYLRGR